MTRRGFLLAVGGGVYWQTRQAGARQRRAPADWRSLFDGKSLGAWKPTAFGGEGDVRVEKGRIVLEMGVTLTGITWTGEVPRGGYEIELEAMRLDGNDFFCGLTFPVQDTHCSFIVGGWGGGVVGLSSLDGLDASENETSQTRKLKDRRWYDIRVRVTTARIQAFIDDEVAADVDIERRRVDIRPEVSLSRPLGIASWQTEAALRHIRLRKIP